MTAPALTIRRYETDSEARAASQIMASAEPWIRGGRTAEQIHRNVTHPQNESYVALIDESVVGIIILAVAIPLIKGYIAALAVSPEHRNRGVGAALLQFAEQRIFRVSPNVFLCVSSFNSDAQRFYRRMGYTQIGVLENYDILGTDEIFMRKTIGPWSTFKPDVAH